MTHTRRILEQLRTAERDELTPDDEREALAERVDELEKGIEDGDRS